MSAVMPVAIVSGALRGEIEMALALMGARDAVLDVVSGQGPPRVQASRTPKGYLLGLAALRARGHLVDAARCVAVEDSLAGHRRRPRRGDEGRGRRAEPPPEALRDAGADLVLP